MASSARSMRPAVRRAPSSLPSRASKHGPCRDSGRGGSSMIEQCVILLGGLGTRLGELAREVPKPLLPVGGRPFVDVLVGEALRRGLRDILLLAGHRSEVVQSYATQLSSRLPEGCRVSVSIEPEPLGTGGALAHA